MNFLFHFLQMYLFLCITLVTISPTYRLNDMWTISLQDREHACWEEACFIHFHNKREQHLKLKTQKLLVIVHVCLSVFVSIRSIRVVKFPRLAATSLSPYAGTRCLCFLDRVEPKLLTTSFSLSSKATCKQHPFLYHLATYTIFTSITRHS